MPGSKRGLELSEWPAVCDSNDVWREALGLSGVATSCQYLHSGKGRATWSFEVNMGWASG
jgi:hypothetical protein